MNVALGEVIEQGIQACNSEQEFLRRHYFAINTKKPSEEEIGEYLADLED